MLDNQYKLVVHDGAGGTRQNIELFDLQADPGEEVDLAEAEPERVAQMSKALREWQDSVIESLTGADYNE